MRVYFFDTSALVKHHSPETGQRWVRRIVRTNAGNLIVISSLTTVEMVSSFVRREREGSMTHATRIRLQR